VQPDGQRLEVWARKFCVGARTDQAHTLRDRSRGLHAREGISASNALTIRSRIPTPASVVARPIGAWLGHGIAGFFTGMFRFPVVVFRVDLDVVAIAAVIAFGAATAGALGSRRRVGPAAA